MPIPLENLRALVARVGEFHIRDGAMRRAQQRMGALLASGGDAAPKEIEGYLAQVRRYFTGFEREARAHLTDVEKRLAHVGQLQFNLTAERGVAAKRIEVTREVLSTLTALAQREKTP